MPKETAGRLPSNIVWDQRTVSAMVALYCRDHHGTQGAPCDECRRHIEYAHGRLAKCPYGPEKTTCRECPIHCYSPAERTVMRDVMRYAGPRMLWRHLLLALRHLWIERQGPPRRRPRTGAGGVLLLLALGALSGCGAGDDGAGGRAELAHWRMVIQQGLDAGALRLTRVQADPSGRLRSVWRYDQYVRGVRVFGAQLVEQRDATGESVVVWDRRVDVEGVEPRARLTAPQILAAAVTPMTRATGEVELVLLPGVSGLRLCYTFWLAGDGTLERLFVDAASGETVLRYSDVWGVGVVAQGRGVWGEPEKLSVDHVGAGRYEARDRLRPQEILTFDARQRFTGEPVAEEIARDSDSEWDDPVVVDAHAQMGRAFDYLAQRHGWLSLDGEGRQPVRVLVHVGPLDYAYFFPSSQAIALGDGTPGWTRTLATLDVAAHELGHGVTFHSWNGIYQGEAAALNEAFSDIIGCSAEFYHQPAGAGRFYADYWIGEDRCEVFDPAACAKRSLADPHAVCDAEGCHPDHYTEYAPQAGAHFNSGIASHAFYLLVEGGRHRLSGLEVTGLGASRRAEAERIFFRGFTASLTPRATFRDAREATLEAARELYGATSAEVTQTAAAWRAVGVE